MRFMMRMIPKGYEQAQPGAMPDPKAVAALYGRARKLLRREAEGDRRDVRRDQGGDWRLRMIQVKSKPEAIEWASR